MPEQQDWDRLADAVTRRRDFLGLTQEEVAARPGAPSTATLRNIENGTGTSYRAKTLYGLDAALLWRRGNALYLVDDSLELESRVHRDETAVEDLIFDTSYATSRGADFRVGAAPKAPGPPSGDPSPLSAYSDYELITELARRFRPRAAEDAGSIGPGEAPHEGKGRGSDE